MERTLVRIGVLREKIALEERAIRQTKKGLERAVRAGFAAESVTGFLLLLLSCAARELCLRLLRRRKRALYGRLYEARQRALQEYPCAAVLRYEAERERERRMREAVLGLRQKYGDRPARICDREPRTDEELRLVEDFLSSAEERHRRCMEAWRLSDYDDAVRERVREDLEKGLPLRRYERGKVNSSSSAGTG